MSKTEMTQQEKKFADQYVFIFFHDYSHYPMQYILEYAGYEVPADSYEVDKFGSSLLSKPEIKAYIDAEIERFRKILSGEQRKNLWKYISAFSLGDAEMGACYGAIIPH